MPFDPDAYLAKATPQGFDPDAYLAKARANDPWSEVGSYVRDKAGKLALKAAPIAGMVTGGLLGSAAAMPGLGTLTGAGAGYALGKEAERAGRNYLYGENTPFNPGDVLGNMGEGAEGELSGQAVSKGVGLLGRGLKSGGIGAAKSHLRATPQMKMALGDEGMDTAAETALKSGAIQAGKKVKTTASNLENLLDEVGSVKGDVLAAADKAGNADPIAVAKQFTTEVIEPLLENSETEAAGKAMIAKRDNFLRKYAPDYQFGGREPGTPTTITRSSKFVPKDVETTYPEGTGEVGHLMDVDFGVGKPVQVRGTATHYSTQEPVTSPPYETEGGLPVKEIAERRLEGVPETNLSPSMLDQVKQAAQKQVNYLATSPQAVARQEGQRGWARVLKEGVEDVAPGVKDPNEAYQNLSNALMMTDRTKALTHGGGLLGHVTDTMVHAKALDEMLSGAPKLAATMEAIRFLTRGRAASTAARSLYGAGGLLEKLGERDILNRAVTRALGSGLVPDTHNAQ